MANEILVGLTIGAALSGSYHAAFASAQNTAKQLGATVKDLTARHTQMGEAMQRATSKLSGGTLAAINRDYEKLGRTIEALRIKQESLTASLARGAALRASRADLRGQFMETAGTAAVIGAPVFQSVRAATGFQDQMRDVAITGEFSPDEEAKIGSTVRAAALQWNQTQEAIGSGIGKLVAGGVQDAQALERYAPIMAKAATATRASMDDLGSVAIALKDNLGIGAEGYEEALNMLAYAGKRGQFEIQDMAKWLPNLTPAFGALGVTGKEAVAEIGAALQIARKGAGSNDEAANNFKNFLQKITSPDTLKDFEKAGIDLKTSMTNLRAQGMTPMQSMLAVITDYMGTKGPEAAGQFQAAMAIKDDKERAAALQRLSEAYKLGELFQDMQAMAFIRPAIANQAEMKDIKQGSMDAADKGALDVDFKKRMDTASEQFKSLKIGMAELGISVGEALLPTLIELTEMAKPFLKTFGEWAKANPGWVRGIVAAGTALLGMKAGLIVLKYVVTGALSFANSFGTAATLISSKWVLLKALWQAGRFTPLITGLRMVGQVVMWLGRALFLNPIGLAVTAIGVAAFLVWKHWATVKAAVLAGWNWLRNLKDQFFSAGADLINGLVSGVSSKLMAARDSIVSFGSSIKGWFTSTLGIQSPSTVFMGFGDNIAQGAAIGIDRSSGLASQSAGRLAEQTAAAGNRRSGPARPGADGGVTIHFAPTINLPAGAAGAKDSVNQALQLSLHELEQMIRRVTEQQARRAYVGA